ncbi:MAG: FAD binding domain-containing protein [Rhodospirillales bacterium]
MYDFSYAKPSSVPEVVRLLGRADAKALAGGQTLIPVLKQRLNRPSIVVDLAALGLAFVRRERDSLVIGGMTRHAAVAASAEVRGRHTGVGETGGLDRGSAGAQSRHDRRIACQQRSLRVLIRRRRWHWVPRS